MAPAHSFQRGAFVVRRVWRTVSLPVQTPGLHAGCNAVREQTGRGLGAAARHGGGVPIRQAPPAHAGAQLELNVKRPVRRFLLGCHDRCCGIGCRSRRFLANGFFPLAPGSTGATSRTHQQYGHQNSCEDSLHVALLSLLHSRRMSRGRYGMATGPDTGPRRCWWRTTWHPYRPHR